MQKLHPNAIWLFWIRSLLGIFPSGRKTVKFLQPVLIMLFYLVIIGYALISFMRQTGGLLGPETADEALLSSWWQRMASSVDMAKATGIIIAVFVVFLVLTFLRAYWHYKSCQYKIKPNSIMVKKGIFLVHEAEVPFERIQNVDIFRGVLHRMLGLSSIYIQTSGYSESTEAVLEKHPGFVSEADIDGISKVEAERIRHEIMKK